MREIKFRAWDEVNRIMLTPDSCGLVIHFDGEINSFNEDGEIIGTSFTKQYPLMQYTGLKDKNGTEIYEGSIYHQGDPKITYTVVWHDTGLIGKQNGSSSYAGLSHWRDRIEVIGNIYENPELLRTEDEEE